MADVLKKGRFYKEILDKYYQYKCICENGNVIWGDTPDLCNQCGDGAMSDSPNSTSRTGFKNMSGGGFSMKNLLIYGAIGFGAFMVYKNFIKK